MIEKQITYNDKITRQFMTASIFWGIIGMLVGVIVAVQLANYKMNLDTSWLTFGRLRPLHTNAVIFAFVGNMIFAGIYYSVQRLVKTRIASDKLSQIHFWGWQLIIVSAALTLPLGFTQGKEYAELEWPIDIAIALVWVVFAINFFWTLARRNEKHLYVAIWFYIASILTVAVLHIVNSLSLPVDFLKSYSIFAGVQDALVQWWYGHNAVAFFLTTPVLGIMYYFMPKAIGKPVYSYKLSIVHFWALVFLYIWAGPHHLLYTSLPEWAQSLGMIFSVALWAPSWGGMINGILTLRGAWEKLREDPIVKFFVAALTFYGMATFEGPMMSIKSVNALSHYTDWTIGHVHGGALGWNGFMAAGVFYWLVPKLYGTQLWSKKMANYHFWMGLVAILLYMAAMYVGGLSQGLMWKALTPEGTLLYPNFLEAIFASQNMYKVRYVAGIIYLASFIMMAFNLWKTARSGKAVESSVTVMVKEKSSDPISWSSLVFNPIILLCLIALGTLFVFGSKEPQNLVLAYIGLAVTLILGFILSKRKSKLDWHEALEGKAFLFTVFALISILIGGLAEIIPIVQKINAKTIAVKQKPYTPLELEGRDIYIREGCYNCHSQMVRPMLAETLRYGTPSDAGEFVYDHPFQWGSKRTGPDLHRVGGKYPDLWHYNHMIDPRSTSEGSLMPNYAFLEKAELDLSKLKNKMKAMQTLGVPYTNEEIAQSESNLEEQAKQIVANLAQAKVQANWKSELIALVSYLQVLGTEMKVSK